MDELKKRVNAILVVVLVLTMWLPMSDPAYGKPGGDITLTELKTEYTDHPLGIDVMRPRLSWKLESDERGQYQTAYKVQVATSEEKLRADAPDMWDTGKVESGQSVNVVYEGKPLESGQRYYWRVKVWDKHGMSSEWSEPAWWEMGLLDESDWRADWVGMDGEYGDAVNNTQQNTPVRLESGHTIGQSFTMNGPFTSVSGSFPTWHTTESGMTLTLYRDGPQGEILARKRFTDVADNSWVTLELEDPLPAGTYYLEASEPEGTIGWWSHTDDVYAGGTAFVDGKAVTGDRTLRVEVPPTPPPLLRKEFAIEKPIERARLYATALGVYEPRINGERVGHDLFAPGWTDYDKRIQYQTYDVTEWLHPGENVVGALLGDGWYAGSVAHLGPNVYGSQPYLKMQLEIDYKDGSSETIVSDASWRTAEGPIKSSDMLMGEVYDARDERSGWDTPGFDATEWAPVKVMSEEVTGKLVAQAAPTVQVTEEIQPVEITEPEPGTYVFDLGQNMVGNVRLKVRGEAGDTVTLRHAEVLNPDGTIYTDNLRSAKATDQYTLKGEGEEIYEPHFTFHGFRYVEVTGLSEEPTLETITGRVMHTAAPFTGEFETSNDLLNQLQSNIRWGQRGNFLSIPTDTPARDERMGWTGDINVFVGASTFNMDVTRFLGSKWLADLRDAQSPNGAYPDVAPKVCCGEGNAGWGDAGVTVPYTIWQRYGDTRVIEENYEAMVRWIEYLEENSADYIRPTPAYGDWLNIDDPTPGNLIATAYFAYSAKLLSEMAGAIGETEDAARFERLFEQIKAAFNEAFVSDDGFVEGDSQTAYVLALYMDLLPEDKRQKAADRLVERIKERDWHLSTGFLGTRDLLPVLSETGYLDIAYRLLLNDTFPSWGYQIKNGATTMWERWDSIKPDGSFQDPAMNSFNHYAYGAVGDWMYRHIAGIQHDPDNPGYKHTIIHPRPGGDLTHAKGKYESVYGTIVSDWEQKDDTFRLNVTIPVNTTATVYVPADSEWAVTESGDLAHEAEGVTFVGMEDGHAVYEVGSGSYAFSAHTLNAADIKKLVEHFEHEGAIATPAAHSLKIHLMAVSRYEEKGEGEKVIKHMEGFLQLLDHQRENEWITEEVYDTLKVHGDALIQRQK